MLSLGMNLHGASFRCPATAAATDFTQEIELIPTSSLTHACHSRPIASVAMGQADCCSLRVPSKPLTEGELCDWIANALVGESIQYHEGLLFIDRSPSTSDLPSRQRAHLHAIARRVWIACELGLVHLFSQKVSDNHYRYIAVRAGGGLNPRDIRARLRNASAASCTQRQTAIQE